MDWFIKQLETYSSSEAIICQDIVYTYKDLLQEYYHWKNVLRSDLVEPGEVVAVYGDYSLEMCALLMALIDNKNIILPLTSESQNHSKFLKISQADRIYDLFNPNKNSSINSLEEKNHLIKKLKSLNAPGLILFSSGSTGEPKGVIHNFQKILKRYQNNRGYSFRTLSFLLLDHIGGINTLFYTLSNGGTIITTRSRKVEDICKIIERYRVELLPTSPTFLNLLILSGLYQNYDFSSLKIISYGTEVMPESVLKKINELFPNVKLKQTYGLSELGILQSKSESSDSVWVKLGGEGYQTKVIDGILYIKSDMAMLGYLNAPSPFDEEGWYNTQDQVLVKGEYFKILGRNSDIINVGGQKVYPTEVEDVIMQMDGVKNVVVFGGSNPIVGNVVLAKVKLTDDFQNIDNFTFKQMVRKYCKNKIEEYKIPVKIEIVEEELITDRYKRVRR